MKTSPTNGESKTDSTENQQTEVKNETVVDNKVDDFGYDKVEGEKAPPKDEKKPDDKKEGDGTGYDKVEGEKAPPKDEKKEEPEEDETGYGKDKKEVDPPKDEKKEEPKNEADKTAEEFAAVLKDLPEAFDKEKIQKFATDNKFSKEQLEAYKKMAIEENAASEKSSKEAIKAQRSAWKKELMEDPKFGKDKFDANVAEVNKVLKNYMPDTKKVLTEKGSVMPPYIMRDLLRISQALNPVNTLVNGEPPAPKKVEGDFLDEMYT